jgi:acyl-CoA reductase-like NAD-dependent aldehyde dehydrogenase
MARAIAMRFARANMNYGGWIYRYILKNTPSRAFDVAQRIASGTVWVNKHLELPPDVPFGGAKQSGFGAEMGQEGLQEFTQSRIINIAK